MKAFIFVFLFCAQSFALSETYLCSFDGGPNETRYKVRLSIPDVDAPEATVELLKAPGWEVVSSYQADYRLGLARFGDDRQNYIELGLIGEPFEVTLVYGVAFLPEVQGDIFCEER